MRVGMAKGPDVPEFPPPPPGGAAVGGGGPCRWAAAGPPPPPPPPIWPPPPFPNMFMLFDCFNHPIIIFCALSAKKKAFAPFP